MPVSPSFWRWLFTAAGTLIIEALVEAFLGDEDDAAKTKKMERRR